MRAEAPSAVTTMARTRWVFSSDGRKCAKTAENEMSSGVSRQCTTQRLDAQMPKLSAEMAKGFLEAVIEVAFVGCESHMEAPAFKD